MLFYLKNTHLKRLRDRSWTVKTRVKGIKTLRHLRVKRRLRVLGAWTPRRDRSWTVKTRVKGIKTLRHLRVKRRLRVLGAWTPRTWTQRGTCTIKGSGRVRKGIGL